MRQQALSGRRLSPLISQLLWLLCSAGREAWPLSIPGGTGGTRMGPDDCQKEACKESRARGRWAAGTGEDMAPAPITPERRDFRTREPLTSGSNHQNTVLSVPSLPFNLLLKKHSCHGPQTQESDREQDLFFPKKRKQGEKMTAVHKVLLF